MLFDGCELLFGGRGAANPRSAALMRALDRFDGLVILTTSTPERLDPTLDRRVMLRLPLEVPTGALREKIWRAHRSHYYQRLVLMGWGHRKVALAEYGVMLGVAASALVGAHASCIVQGAIVAGWDAVYVALLVTIDARWRRRPTTTPGT